MLYEQGTEAQPEEKHCSHLQHNNFRMRGGGLKLLQGRFWLVIRTNFFSERVVKYWNRLSREVVELLTLEVLRKRVNVALRDIV